MDKWSAPILQLDEKLRGLGNVGGETQKKLTLSPHAKLWGELNEHVKTAKEGFAGLGENIGEMGNRLGDVLPMLGALGGVASVGGLIELVHATAEAAEALHNVALITGMTVPQLQSLDFAAKQSGLSSDQLSGGIERLNANIGKAAEGKSKQVAALFHAMGINLRDANGHIKSASEILPQLEASFQKTTDPALRSAMAMALFGRAGEDLIPFLTEGPKKIAAAQAQFNKFGYSFSETDQAGLEKFNSAWKDVSLSVEGLGSAISAKVAPVLAPLLEQFATWVADNKAWIATDIATDVGEFGDALKKIDWKQIGVDFKDIGSHTTALKLALIACGAAMAIDFMAPMIGLGVQVGKLGFSMLKVAIPAVIDFSAAMLGMTFEIGGARDAMAALSLAAEANPLGALIVGVTLAGGAAYELYEHWGWVTKELHGLWKGTEKDFGMVFNGTIMAGMDVLSTAAGGFSAAWKLAGTDLHGIWKVIETDFNNVFGGIEKTLRDFGKNISAIEADLGFGPNAVPAGGPAPGPGGHEGEHYVRGRFGGQWLPDAPRLSPSAPPGAPGAAGASGKVDVTVNFNNPPAGLQVVARSTGTGSAPKMNVGRNGTIRNHRSYSDG
jgi:hypothetical protein